MARIRIDRFGGLAPRQNRRRLPPLLSQRAENARLDSDDLRSWRIALPTQGLGSGQIGNLWPYETAISIPKLIAFGRNFDVSFVRSPVADDAHERIYWCVHGEGIYAISEPRNPTPPAFAVPSGTGPNYRQHRGYRVGIARPEGDLAASEEAVDVVIGAGSAVEISEISSTNPARVQCSTDIPFENGDEVQWTLSDGVSNESPFLDFVGSTFVVRNILGNSFELAGLNATAITWPPEDVEHLILTRQVPDAQRVSRAYVITYVNIFGEEGPPSDPSNVIDIEEDGGVALIELTMAQPAEGEPELINRIRVYRSISGTSGTRYVFVGTLPTGTPASPDADGLEWETQPAVATVVNGLVGTVRDAVPAVEVGEDLPTESWYAPPRGSLGLEMMPQGYAVTAKGNTLYLSELNLPHAWPPEYRLTCDEWIVGIKAIGEYLVIGTKGAPYIMTGVDPAAASLRRVDARAPLLHPLAMVDAGGVCLFPATDGLYAIAPGRSERLTREFDKDDWLDIGKPRDRAVWHDERYILYGTGVDPYVFQFRGTGNALQVSTMTEQIGAACVAGDTLYVVPGSAYNTAAKFDSGFAHQTATWRSGLFTLRQPVGFAVGQVFAEGYPIQLRLLRPNPSSYTDSQGSAEGEYDLDETTFVVFEKEVRGAEPFRVPGTDLSREWIVEIVGQHRVISVTLASSMDELRQS